MIIQPERGTRNVNHLFYEMETRQIAMLNEIFGDVELTEKEMRTLVWLAGWEAVSYTHLAMTFEPELNDKSIRFAVHETVTFLYNQYTEH